MSNATLVSIRAPRTGRNASEFRGTPIYEVFQSAPRGRGETLAVSSTTRNAPSVSIRAPRTGRNVPCPVGCPVPQSFNPRPADGAKRSWRCVLFAAPVWFQSAPRGRGETVRNEKWNIAISFNPRPADGAKREHRYRFDWTEAVSIRAPRTGRNNNSPNYYNVNPVSIRAPRTGRNH